MLWAPKRERQTADRNQYAPGMSQTAAATKSSYPQTPHCRLYKTEADAELRELGPGENPERKFQRP